MIGFIVRCVIPASRTLEGEDVITSQLFVGEDLIKVVRAADDALAAGQKREPDFTWSLEPFIDLIEVE